MTWCVFPNKLGVLPDRYIHRAMNINSPGYIIYPLSMINIIILYTVD